MTGKGEGDGKGEITLTEADRKEFYKKEKARREGYGMENLRGTLIKKRGERPIRSALAMHGFHRPTQQKKDSGRSR